LEDIAHTEHGRFVFVVKEYATEGSEYRVFLSAEPREASEVPSFSIWLKEGTEYDEARALAAHLNRLADTVAAMTFLTGPPEGSRPS
jgi:hypothetical protein